MILNKYNIFIFSMKLLSWIKINKLNWYFLSSNPNAISLLEDNFDNIDWFYLSSNPNGIDLLIQNFEYINVHMLSANPSGIDILRKHQKHIVWSIL
jgi:hypothetical protein